MPLPLYETWRGLGKQFIGFSFETPRSLKSCTRTIPKWERPQEGNRDAGVPPNGPGDNATKTAPIGAIRTREAISPGALHSFWIGVFLPLGGPHLGNRDWMQKVALGAVRETKV